MKSESENKFSVKEKLQYIINMLNHAVITENITKLDSRFLFDCYNDSLNYIEILQHSFNDLEKREECIDEFVNSLIHCSAYICEYYRREFATKILKKLINNKSKLFHDLSISYNVNFNSFNYYFQYVAIILLFIDIQEINTIFLKRNIVDRCILITNPKYLMNQNILRSCQGFNEFGLYFDIDSSNENFIDIFLREQGITDLDYKITSKAFICEHFKWRTLNEQK